jgi:hypothetical protein
VARYGVAIQKRCGYRLGTQHFSNQYYYEMNIPSSNLSDLDLVVDEIVAKEKAMFSTAVTFVRGRLWSQVGTPAQNEMLIDKALSGTGAAATDPGQDREAAFLVRARAGNDSRGRPVYLRKWFHLLVTSIAGAAIDTGVRANTSEIPAAARSALETFFNSLKAFTVSGQNVQLVAKSGRQITGATQAHRFLESRALGDEWRGQ